MIIKILSVFEQALIPESFVETHLVETDDFKFQNHIYNSDSEFKEVLKKISSDTYSCDLHSDNSIEHKWIPKDMEKKMRDWINKNSEYPILSTLILSQKSYILLGCSVYVMNNQGKTIDHLNTHAFFTPSVVEKSKTEDDTNTFDDISTIMEKVIESEGSSKMQILEDVDEWHDNTMCEKYENGEINIQKFINTITDDIVIPLDPKYYVVDDDINSTGFGFRS